MTVGVVIVSHSRALAEGTAELARTLGLDRVRVEPAGGDSGGGLGTSAELVAGAVSRADSGDGVVLLADLGSAVLTVKTYLLDAPGTALFADAPLVEGAVAAASAAASGAGAEEVAAAAREAYAHRKG
ncbi:PTS-dependent dihydroxyacetone kinase phosphotransferase subunit DhaM [Bailinhaonella thermotolerans]|uniref:Phosphoenolpyruvate--protein phosphotransferase n=1 Tax=Bailinhaonella thermotolerans TaxID=1070861 RepID=A0A3A4AV47_9ACTN|nr:phosphoenolpyruvate--protein phosphotransferase [Bailinhaonella thermotolerans]RJL34100.1 phosphoenolpyruvate--protein phosphotransferase [Bailinhaonella thermotolerans]